MRDILINSQKIQLPFIFERSYKDDNGSSTIKYLVTHDYIVENEVDEKDQKFVLIELEDGFVYTMTVEEMEECIKDGGNIRAFNSLRN